MKPSQSSALLLLRYAEVHLKGNNRAYFIGALVANVKKAVRPIGGEVWFNDNRIYVRADDLRQCASLCKKVFGVHSVSPAVITGKGIDEIKAAAIALMQGKTGTFKAVARRSDKTFPMRSPEIASEIGGAVLAANPGLKADMTQPAHTLEIEVRDSVYLHAEKQAAAGGMPYGTAGRAMLLLSGGIDSPVAGYMMAKRGVTIEALHFFSHPYTSEFAKQKVIDLARILAGYCGGIRLRVVPFTNIQMRIYEKCPPEELTIIMRRFMMRIAQLAALDAGCQALITGESMAQVASQTMQGLVCTDAAVTMPVFRPLIGFDKIEIIDRAKAVGTFDTSILPYEDCCTVFTPKHPVTRPRLERIEASERALPVDDLVAEAVGGIDIIDCISGGTQVDA